MSAPNPSTPEATRPVVESLRKALESFAPNGEKWANGYPAGNTNCAWTACENADTAAVLLAAGCFNDDALKLFRWNDAPERTFADVKALFEKAIAKAEAQ